MGLWSRITGKETAVAVQAERTRILADLKTQIPALVRQARTSAMFSGGRSSGGKWPGGMSSSRPGVTFSNWDVRNQARDVVEDSIQAKALVNRSVDTVVDSGLTLEPEPRADYLGISPEFAEAWGRQTSEAFDLWARSKKQHRAGTMTFYQAQHLVQRYNDRDGEFLVRLYYEPNRRDLLNPLMFEILDVNQLRGDAFTSTLFKVVTDDGIIRGEDGTEQAYKIWVTGTDGITRPVTVNRFTPSGLTQILHGFKAEYAGQGRGLSPLAVAIANFEQITDFEGAYIQKAINQASITIFNKPSKEKPNSDPFAGIEGDSAAGVAGSTTIETAEFTPSQLFIKDIPEATLLRPGVAHVQVDSGEELVPFESTAPTGDFGAFVDAFCSYICASQGMPIEVLLMKFSNNYSASRATLLLFWRIACMKREHLADDLLNPIYEAWMAGEISSGRISAPGWSDPRIRAAWLTCRWNGTPMPNIDPNQTAEADRKYAEMGAQTLDDIARNLNGSSGKANRAKLAKETAELSGAEFPWTEKAAAAPTAGPDPLDQLRTEIDAYGIAVRGGVVTPQASDEDYFRKKAGLPPMSPEAQSAWSEENLKVRRPITLTQLPGSDPGPGFGQTPAPAKPSEGAPTK